MDKGDSPGLERKRGAKGGRVMGGDKGGITWIRGELRTEIKGENSRRSTGKMKTKNLVALSLLKALRAPGDASALGSLSRGGGTDKTYYLASLF